MLAPYLRDDPSLALATDLYELSMAQGYWKNRMLDTEAIFHLFYRSNPFGGGYVVWVGLADALAALRDMRFSSGDLAYLATLKNRHDGPLFDEGFLAYLADFRFSCDVRAMPEGTVVFPNEPLLEVRGPILQAQVVETLLLAILNFQSLVATKAARIVEAAQGDPVVDFGLRRAQGLDGGFSASRAAYVGGCTGTSNVLAGKHLGMPVLGTFAHSWVMSFHTEPEAFEAFAHSMPDNCVFLVDTYGSLEGVRNAIQAGLRLRERGHEMVGIRLDSGDLAWLSIQARKMLDEAGFTDALVMGSSDLDEWLIRSLKAQDARINAWGVGTRLVTAHDDPALGGVYKLSAIKKPGQTQWQPRLKLSETKAKINIPGMLQVYRCQDAEGRFLADAIVEEAAEEARKDQHAPAAPRVDRIIDPNDNTKHKELGHCARMEPMLVSVMQEGRIVEEAHRPETASALEAASPLEAASALEAVSPLEIARARASKQLARLHQSHHRFENPHVYPVGLSPELNARRDQMIAEARVGAKPPELRRKNGTT